MSMMKYRERNETDSGNLGPDEFARMFGVTVNELSAACCQAIDDFDLRYRVLMGTERDEVMIETLQALDRDLSVSGPQRLGRWEEGWAENRDAFIASGYEDEALIPGYYRREISAMRLFGDYILPEVPHFEVKVLNVLQTWLAETFLSSVDHVYEFGCGPAHNLLAFARIFPDKAFHGLDWAQPSQEIVQLIARHKGLKFDGRRFDMFHPDSSYRLDPGSALLTIGSMEQLGRDFSAFFDYMFDQNADLYLHVEPIKELHDPSKLIDHIAIRYMDKRGYLDGFLDRLRQLESDGKICITHCRVLIGSTHCNGWNLVVWKKK